MTKLKVSYSLSKETIKKIKEIYQQYNMMKLQKKEKVLSESEIADILILLGYRAIMKKDVPLHMIEKEAEKWRH